MWCLFVFDSSSDNYFCSKIWETPAPPPPPPIDTNTAHMFNIWRMTGVQKTTAVLQWRHKCFAHLVCSSPEGRPGMSNVLPLSGISGCNFMPLFLHIWSFCLVLCLFLSSALHPPANFPKICSLFFHKIGFSVWPLRWYISVLCAACCLNDTFVRCHVINKWLDDIYTHTERSCHFGHEKCDSM